MSDPEKRRLHVVVEGRVQGVGFRYYVLQVAEPLGLVGWVRNLDNGDVEVTAEGPRQALDKLLAALQRGPSSAFVSHVQVEWSPATGEYRRFGVTHAY